MRGEGLAVAEPVRIRGDESRGERRQHRESTGIENGIGGPGYKLRVIAGRNACMDVIRTDHRTGPADRRKPGPVSPRHAELEAEILRLRGFQAALEENARLHKLLADANALLAVAKPDQEAMARDEARLFAGDAAGAVADEVAP